MAYLGIGYSGGDRKFLANLVNDNQVWLKGDRNPRFFGDSFLVMYDSNIAREFAKMCKNADNEGNIVVYPMERPFSDRRKAE